MSNVGQHFDFDKRYSNEIAKLRYRYANFVCDA